MMMAQGMQQPQMMPQQQPMGFAQAATQMPPGTPGTMGMQHQVMPGPITPQGMAPRGSQPQITPLTPPAPGQGFASTMGIPPTQQAPRPLAPSSEGDPFLKSPKAEFDSLGRLVNPPMQPTDTIQQEVQVKDQPIASFQPKPAAPAEPPRINFPKLTQPGKPSLKFSTGTIPGKAESTISSDNFTAAAIADMRAKGLKASDLQRQYDELAIKSGGKVPPLDHQMLQDIRDEEYWSNVATIKQQLASTMKTTPPEQIEQMAQREASAQMNHYAPQKGGNLIGITPEEVKLSYVKQGLEEAANELSLVRKIIDAGGNPQGVTRNLNDILSRNPHINDTERQHFLTNAAADLKNRIQAKLDPNSPFPDLVAMRKAAELTGGVTPPQWIDAISGNYKNFGLTDSQVAMYRRDPVQFNVLTKEGYNNLLNADADASMMADLNKRKSMDPQHAEVYDAQIQALQQKSAQPKIGEMTRQIDVQQREAESAAGTRGVKEEERKQVVQQVTQPLSDLAKALRRYMEIPLSQPEEKAKAASLYKDLLVSNRSVLAKGILMQSGALNEQEQVAAIRGLSGLVEAGIAPDITREKIAILNRTLSANFGKPVDLLADDPFNPTAPQSIRVDRSGRPMDEQSAKFFEQGQPSSAVAGQPQPNYEHANILQQTPRNGPTTPPPWNPQQAQPQSSLPPIADKAQEVIRQNPQEGAPKVGPNKGVSTPMQALKQARAAIPDEIRQMMAAEPEFKQRLKDAEAKYKGGQMTRDQLEREVVKIVGRLGSRRNKAGDKALLEGERLNATVKAIMDAYTAQGPVAAGVAR
jgi:hypothetical protein